MMHAQRLPLLLLVGGCLAAGACTPSIGDGASLEQSVASPQSRLVALAPDRPSGRRAEVIRPLAALPPEAGPVKGVQEHDYADGLRQDVILGGGAFAPVRNGITVLARTSDIPTLDERVPLYRPAEAGIRAEVGTQFPHVAMQVVERSMANAYGPYGLALGRVGGDARCLYMWQWIDANRLPADAGVNGPISLRVRLCQAGMSFDKMAGLIDHLSIGAAPAVAVLDPAELVGAFPAAAGAAPLRARARHARAHRHAPAVRTARRAPAVVPLDSVATVPSEPRYLTAATARGGSVPAVAPPAAPAAFAADLPPQALLGPKAGAVAGTPKPF